MSSIETAFVDIRPDFSGFAIETERGIKRALAGVEGEVDITPDTSSIRRANRDITAMNGGLRGAASGSRSAAAGLGLLGGAAARVGTIGAAGVTGVAVAAGIAAKAVADASIQYETAFSGVRKTVDATEPELQALRQGFIDLSTEIPVSAVELAGIGEAAGQLGVKTGAIDEFTETVANLAATTNLTADVASDSLARIANITGLPQTQFENLGSTIVDLGNRLAATETEIVEFGLRIAGAGKQVGLSESQILSIGASLASVGLEAEAGGTAISTTLVKIASAVASGGKKLDRFAKVAGVSAEEFRKSFAEEPAAALVSFIEGLSRVSDAGGNVFATLEQLGLGGIRVRDSLLRTAGAGDLLARSLKIGEEAFESNNALQREAGIRYETTAAKIQILRNQVDALAIEMGDRLGPAIGEGAEALGEGIEALRENEDVGNTIANGFENLQRAVGPLFDVFERNQDTIADTFRNAGEGIRVLSVLLKPVATLVGVTLVAAFETAFFVLDKVNRVSRLFGDILKKSVSVAVGAIDLFLGALSFLTDAIDRIPGVDLSGTTSAINEAREDLRLFVDELNGVDGKTVRASVEVDLPFSEVFSFTAALEAARDATTIKPGQKKKPPAFGEPGFTPLPAPSTKPGTDVGGAPLVDVPKAIAAKEQRLQDNLDLARALDESTENDRQALGVLAAFYDEQAANVKLAAALRRGFSVRAEQARAEIRGLDQQAVESAQSDAETRARGQIAVAEATRGTLVDDIRAARTLVAVLKQRVQVAKQTGSGIASAQEQLRQAQRDVVDKINERKERRVSIRVDTAKQAVTIADATELNLRDDVEKRRLLVAALRKRVEVAKQTGGDVQAARDQLKAAERDLAATIIETGEKRADLVLDAIQDQKTLASFTAGKGDDERALRAEERFWQKRVESLKKGTVARRKARVELERARSELRDLRGETDEGGGTTLADLFAKQVGIGRSAGFDVGPQIPGQVTQRIEDEVTTRLQDPTVHIRQARDTGVERQVESNDQLIAALDRLRVAVVGNVSASTGSGGTAYADPAARRAAASRYWQVHRNKQLREETASA